MDSAPRLRLPFVTYLLVALCFLTDGFANTSAIELGDKRLFMSSTERENIDRHADTDGTEQEPKSVKEPTTPVEVEVKKRRRVKVTLDGAVIRPDGTAIVLLNGESRVIPYVENNGSRLSFEVSYEDQLLRLKPGQSVRVETSRDE